MKNKIKVTAPGKLMIMGEHAVVYGRPCVVTAVDQRIHVTLEKTDSDLVVISAPDLKVENYSIKISDINIAIAPKEVKFILATIVNFFNKYGLKSGLSITTKSGFSSLFGFGSSSAVTAAVVKGLTEIFDIQVTKKELFDIAYKSVLDVQGVGSGFDIAAAIWGGTLYFAGLGSEITPLNINEIPLVVGYTGIKADTTTLVKQVAELAKTQKAKVDHIFVSIQSLVEEGKTALINTNYAKLGELMDENQKLLSDLGVSTKELDRLIKASKDSGALGAKLSGAGGGDCMIALVNKDLKPKVSEAIAKAGGTVIAVKTGAEGVRIEI